MNKNSVKMTVLARKPRQSFIFLRKNREIYKEIVEVLSTLHYNRQGSPKLAGKVAELRCVGENPLAFAPKAAVLESGGETEW